MVTCMAQDFKLASPRRGWWLSEEKRGYTDSSLVHFQVHFHSFWCEMMWQLQSMFNVRIRNPFSAGQLTPLLHPRPALSPLDGASLSFTSFPPTEC